MKQKILLLGLLLVALGGALVIYFLSTKMKQATVKIGGAEIMVEVADTDLLRYRGLSGRGSLCDNCGMLFVFPDSKLRNFHMKEMKFPLDMIFINSGRVVEIRKDVPFPHEGEEVAKVASTEAADMVLEVNAGFSATNKLTPGEMVSVDLSD